MAASDRMSSSSIWARVAAVPGAALATLKVVTTATGGYTGMELTLVTDDADTDPIISGTVKLVVAGTTSSSAPLDPTATAACIYGSSKWTCIAGGGKQWDTITGLKISVVDPAVV
jgi:hypothetical protein